MEFWVERDLKRQKGAQSDLHKRNWEESGFRDNLNRANNCGEGDWLGEVFLKAGSQAF